MKQLKETISFLPDSNHGAALLAWWKSLDNRRGPRAELRRCRDVADVLMTQEFYNALRSILPGERNSVEAFARVVGLLAHVEQHDPHNPFAKRLARGDERSTPLVSGLRFRRLLTVGVDGLYIPMLRILRLAGRKADIHDLATSVYWWNERTRKDWARHYYENAMDQA
ncbi:MAG: type I-E CRISPR-associated protein Cse2/CasB [Ignavibacteriae bacterium]|nr:type I-E CRISPR-associated protein Cse2/CasB [Ignavibacteriota bacterium]